MYVLECSSVCVCILILVYVEHLHTCVRNTSERVLVFLEVIIDQLVTQRATLLYYTCNYHYEYKGNVLHVPIFKIQNLSTRTI